MKLLLFGITRDIVGQSEVDYELKSTETNVGKLLQDLKNQFPELSKLNSLAIAVNEEYAQNDVIIDQNDTVALIPPVSGG